MSTVAVIDYGSGNLRSAAKALERAAREAGLPDVIEVTADAARVAAADRIVLPGVGAFGDCRKGLDAIPGMIDTLQDTVIRKGRPFLGICVGMQLMASRGLEHGVHPGLDWIAGDVAPLQPRDPALKIPHMGWNTLRNVANHPVLDGIGDGAHAYFVHSYALVPAQASDMLASVDYGGTVLAVAGRNNLVGTQFHPEKSQAVGLRLLGNFLRWRP
jgi:glutamine amidotransferase